MQRNAKALPQEPEPNMKKNKEANDQRIALDTACPHRI